MRITSRSAALTLALVLSAAAWRQQTDHLTLQSQSKVWIEGVSTIRSFSCSAPTVNAYIETRSANAIPQVLAGEHGVTLTEIKVPVDKIECSNGTMNDHLREALKSHFNPTITFRVTSYDVSKGAEGVKGTLTGSLSIAGVVKPVSIAAVGTADGEMLRVTGSKEIKMTDWDVIPPALMFGRIKVRDDVTVKFDLLLKN